MYVDYLDILYVNFPTAAAVRIGYEEQMPGQVRREPSEN